MERGTRTLPVPVLHALQHLGHMANLVGTDCPIGVDSPFPRVAPALAFPKRALHAHFPIFAHLARHLPVLAVRLRRRWSKFANLGVFCGETGWESRRRPSLSCSGAGRVLVSARDSLLPPCRACWGRAGQPPPLVQRGWRLRGPRLVCLIVGSQGLSATSWKSTAKNGWRRAQPCDDYPSMGCTLIAKLLAGPGRPAGNHRANASADATDAEKDARPPGLPRTRALDWTGPLRRLQHRPIDRASSSSCERATANHGPWPNPRRSSAFPAQLWTFACRSQISV
jgi:hypothetical protein